MLEEIFDKEELAVVEGDKEVSRQLLELPFDHIFFTGGTEIGKIIMTAAAKNLTSVTLELGGKSPVIIERSADIDLAAKRVAWGKFINSGQTCIAPDYILTDAEIIDEVKEKIKTFAQTYFADNSDLPYTGIVDGKHKAKLDGLLNDAAAKGARVEKLNEFNSPDKIDPVILTGITESAAILNEEIFGPILPLIPFSSEDELFDIIDGNPNPLSLYIFSRNNKFVKRAVERVNTGSVVVNDTVLHFADYKLPFGGVRQSGIGRSHGFYGFRAFSNETAFFKQPRFSVIGLLYPPYNNFKRRIIDITEKYL
jgi:aldehyde dehydrogenase (NAD+)